MLTRPTLAVVASLLLAAVVFVAVSPDERLARILNSAPTSSLSSSTGSSTGSWSIELIIRDRSLKTGNHIGDDISADKAVSAFKKKLADTLVLPDAHIDANLKHHDGDSYRLDATLTGLNGAQIIQANRRYAAATDFLNTAAASRSLGLQVVQLYDPTDQWPSNEKRAALYWDGKNPIDMPVSLLATGNVAEMVYVFSSEEMAAAGMEVNGTHAIFPLPHDHQNPLIRAGVTQKYNTPGMERTRSGVAVLQALQTPISMFPDTLGGFAEKISITSHTGDWGGKRAADWEAKLTIPSTKMSDLDLTKPLAAQPQGQQWLKRSKAALSVVSSSRFGASLLESLADPLQLKALRAMQDTKKAPSFVSQSKKLSSEAARWSQGAQNTIPEGHQTNCIHFTNAEGVIPLPGAMAFPLDTPIMTYKGQTELPSHTISMMAGIGAFNYDTSTGTLEIRIAFSAEGIARDPSYTRPQDAITQGVYAQSPPDGQDFDDSQKESDGSIKDDRDLSKSVPSAMAHDLYKVLTTQTPIDFGMMYLDLSHWCKGKDVVQTKVADFEQYFLYMHKQSQESSWREGAHTALGTQLFKQASKFAKLNANAYVQTAVTVTMPCGNNFERSPTGTPNFAGLLEMTTWAHFMLEQSAISPKVIYYAASRQDWDVVK